MARITTEYGKGREFVFKGPSRNLTVIYEIVFLIIDFGRRNRYHSSSFKAEHTVRLYKDKMEICKYSDMRRKYSLYSYDEIKSVKKGIKVFKTPLVLASLIICFTFAAEYPAFALAALPFVPACFSRCITITLKNHRVIKIPYYAFQYNGMIEMIIGNFL